MKKYIKEFILSGVLLLVYIIGLTLNISMFRNHNQSTGIEIFSKRFFVFAIMLLISIAVIWVYPFLKGILKHIVNCVVFLIPCVMLFFTEKSIDGLVEADSARIILNIVIVYSLYLIAWAIMGIKVGTAAFTAFMGVLFVINHFVILFRGRPVLPADVYALGTALGVADNYEFVLELDLFFMIMATVSMVIVPLEFKRPKRNRKFILIRNGVWLALGAAVLGVLIRTDILPDKGYKNEPFIMGASYSNNGFYLSTVLSLNSMIIDKPEGYSHVELKNYPTYDYTAYDDVVPENIILIMNESWADLKVVDQFETNIGYMDYYDSLEENTLKGYLTMPVFGAGTSSSEWEVLTGNSVAFLPDEVSAYEMYSKKNEYGLATTLKSQGYSTVAMHPFWSYTWNRASVYSYMGFDEFHSVEYYDNCAYVRDYISDETSYRHIIDYINNKPEGEKAFVFTVTIQNHGGYTGTYNNFLPEVYTERLSRQYEGVNNYLSLAKITDDALEYLIEYYKDFDENTMIVMFGDHLPAVETDFYNEIADMPVEVMPLNQQQLRYKTPYLVWTNYDSDMEDIGDISSNYFGSYILKCANVEMSQYNKFQLYASKIVPFLGYQVSRQKEGQEISEEIQDIINMYECYQYNYIFGGDSRQDKLFKIN